MKIPEPRKLPSGNWFIQLRLGGVSVPVTAATAKECKDAAALIKAEHRAGKRQAKRSKADLTLRQAIDDYIAERQNVLSPATIRGYRTVQRNRFKTVMDMKLKDIDNWQKICNKEAKLISAKTLQNAWGLVSPVLRNNKLPVPEVTLPQVVKKERPWLEPEHIKAFIKAVKGKTCEIPALLQLHGMRCSEMCAVDWEKNIDLKNRRILVSGAFVLGEDDKLVYKETNKNKYSRRYVPIMINELYEALNAVEKKTGLLIKQRPNTIYRQINKACEEAGLPKVGNHGLRHSFASLAYHLGIPEMAAMKIGGWSDYKTMREIYTHLADRDLEKHTRKMIDFFDNANENANETKTV